MSSKSASFSLRRYARYRQQRGMTLPDLMVSVVIVGVLASVGIGTYRERVASARSTEALATLGEVQKATERSAVTRHQFGEDAFNFQVNTFGSTKGFGKGNDKGKDKTNKDSELDNDGNNGHGNNEGKCDPSNPGKSKNCDDSSSSGGGDSSSNGKSDKTNKDSELDNDGNNGHGNNEGKCDPSNPGNSKHCDDSSDGSDSGDDTSSDGSDGSSDSSSDGSDSGDDASSGNDGSSDSSGSGTDSGSDSGSGNDSSSDSGSGDDTSSDSGGDGSGDSTGGSVAGSIKSLCDTAAPIPESIAMVRGAVYSASPTEWSTGDRSSGWKCLGVSRSGNQRYQYGYDRSSGSSDDSSSGYTAWARGDLDGDGRTSLFRMRGEVINGNLVHASSIEVIDPTE